MELYCLYIKFECAFCNYCIQEHLEVDLLKIDNKVESIFVVLHKVIYLDTNIFIIYGFLF
jgi:hypothetical protein